MTTLLLLVLAGDVYVDPLKGDDATGAPFRSVAKALAAMKEGDTLHLAKGLYRESIVVERGGITIDGHGATLTGLEPLDKAAFAPHAPGVFKVRLPAYAKAAPRAVLDGETLMGESVLEEIHEGDFVWRRDELFVALPEGKTWEKATLALRTRRDGLVVKGVSNVVVRDLISDQWEGDAFRVEGRAEGVRFVNCEGRYAVGGESRGLHVKDGATVAAAGCRFSRNGMGAHAIHRSRTSLTACVFEDNLNVGARVNGAEHAFEDCVFRGNGAADLMAVSLSPDSSNGGGPSNVRATRCLFAGGKGPGLVVQLGDHGGEAVARESVFAKGVAVKLRGGTYLGDFNLFGGKFETEEESLDLAAWRTSTKADAASEAGPVAPSGWKLGGRDIGPR
ncbi:MAG TPA: right-handed parallel beta-helix repeat-containing protein [Planctomycetota bacterium]